MMRKLGLRLNILIKKLQPRGDAMYALAAALVILAGSVIANVAAAAQNSRNEERLRSSLNDGVSFVENTLQQRMNNYEEILRSGAALFTITGQVSRNQWQRFIRGFDVVERYPGTLALGYAEHVRRLEVTGHIARMKSGGLRDNYSITPAGERKEYTPLVYVEVPGNQNARPQYGFDMYSDPARRAAMQQARDSSAAALTDPVTLLNENQRSNPQPGLLLYFPVYSYLSDPQNIEQRRAELSGYTFATLRMGDFMAGLFGEMLDTEQGGLEVTAVKADGEKTTLYTSPNYQTASEQVGAATTVKPISMAGRTWELKGILTPAAARNGAITPLLIFVGGVSVSILLGAFLYVLMMQRLSRVAAVHEQEVQQAKDDLLALASHQLRTPASGVKQYLGMVLQGYAGKLPAEQKAMLQKAFAANERQLDIINQLLSVAKADAGQLRVEKQRHDLTRLVGDIVNECGPLAKDKGITLGLRRGARVWVNADERYVRMIVENMLTNAVKYSYPDRPVDVSVTTRGRRAVLRVKDQGVGIAEDEQAQLFQKFTRFDNEMSGLESGSGIGLFLAQELALAHGGSINVKSTKGKGSTFTLSLPGVVAVKRTLKGPSAGKMIEN